MMGALSGVGRGAMMQPQGMGGMGGINPSAAGLQGMMGQMNPGMGQMQNMMGQMGGQMGGQQPMMGIGPSPSFNMMRPPSQGKRMMGGM